MTTTRFLRLVALLCFVLAAFGVAFPPVASLIPVGLAFWVASEL